MNIYEKLLKIQQKISVPKSQTNEYSKYNYRSCEDILEALKPLLAEVGAVLTLDDEIIERNGRFYVKATATLISVDDGKVDTITNTAYAREEETKKGLDASQITGSCSSYARKYALGGLLLLNDAKDADAMDNRDPEERQQAPKKITDTQAKKLEYKCDCDHIDIKLILKEFKVKELTELTEAQLEKTYKYWDKLKEKAGK